MKSSFRRQRDRLFVRLPGLVDVASCSQAIARLFQAGAYIGSISTARSNRYIASRQRPCCATLMPNVTYALASPRAFANSEGVANTTASTAAADNLRRIRSLAINSWESVPLPVDTVPRVCLATDVPSHFPDDANAARNELARALRTGRASVRLQPEGCLVPDSMDPAEWRQPTKGAFQWPHPWHGSCAAKPN